MQTDEKDMRVQIPLIFNSAIFFSLWMNKCLWWRWNIPTLAHVLFRRPKKKKNVLMVAYQAVELETGGREEAEWENFVTWVWHVNFPGLASLIKG